MRQSLRTLRRARRLRDLRRLRERRPRPRAPRIQRRRAEGRDHGPRDPRAGPGDPRARPHAPSSGRLPSTTPAPRRAGTSPRLRRSLALPSRPRSSSRRCESSSRRRRGADDRGGRRSASRSVEARETDFVQSFQRGLAVIRAFDADNPALTLSEVARATGLARAAARRFLLTLVELGYMRVEDRRFTLTPSVLELGHAYLSSLTLPEIALPYMRDFVSEVRESSSLCVLDEHHIVYVARVPANRIMSVSISVGTRFPAFATSTGRVLLAGQSDEWLADLPRDGRADGRSRPGRSRLRSGSKRRSSASASRAGRWSTRSSRRAFARSPRRSTTPPAGSRRRSTSPSTRAGGASTPSASSSCHACWRRQSQSTAASGRPRRA